MNQMARIVAAPVDFKARFTAEEFVQIAEASAQQDIRLELIDGELERMSPPMGNHVFHQTGVIAALLQAVRGTGLKAVVEVGIDLGTDTIVTADAALLISNAAGNRFFLPEDLKLVVEVAEATLDRDLGPKRIKYAVAGVPEYWVVDGGHSAVHVFRAPRDGEYTETDLVRFGQPLPVPGTDATITLD